MFDKLINELNLNSFLWVLLIPCVAILTACGGGSSAEQDRDANMAVNVAPKVTVTAINLLPTVEAGDNFSVHSGDQVSLLATAVDNDGSIVSYQWIQVSGTPVSINDESNQMITFIAPSLSPGGPDDTLIFEVIVTDNEKESVGASISLTVTEPKIVTLSWAAPTNNEDGTELTDLSGFKIYYGKSIDQLTNIVDVSDSLKTDYIFEDLKENSTYYFAIAAVNSSGFISARSEIADIVI